MVLSVQIWCNWVLKVLAYIPVEREKYFILPYCQTVLLDHDLGGENVNIQNLKSVLQGL